MKRTILSFLIILCATLAVQAQPAPIYTLKSCLEQGLLNNYSLRITRNEHGEGRFITFYFIIFYTISFFILKKKYESYKSTLTTPHPGPIH